MRLMVLPFALLTAPVAAQEAAPPAPVSEELVVRGTRIADTEAAMRSCIARRCPVDEEVTATLKHAENLFLHGKAEQARAVLRASVTRNRRHGRAYPVAVSELMRADARVAAHLGDIAGYRSSSLAVVSALKAGLGPDDRRTLVAQVELADSIAKLGSPIEAETSYLNVARRAELLDLGSVQGFALLRVAALRLSLAEQDPARWRDRADAALEQLIATTDPRQQSFARAAKVMKARLAAQAGDRTAVDAMIAGFDREAPEAPPVLLLSAPIRLSAAALGAAAPASTHWVDVGFWVAPDGRPAEVDVLRQSDAFDPQWLPPVIKAIEARRYTPLALDPADPGLFRVERYSFIPAQSGRGTGRRHTRATPLRVEMLDLSQGGATSLPVAVVVTP